MLNNFKIRLYTGFSLAIALIAATGVTSYVISQKQQVQRTWVRKARAILDTTTSIQKTLMQMENARIQYRATGDKQFLVPYYSDLKRIDTPVVRLKDLLADEQEMESVDHHLMEDLGSLFLIWKKNDGGGDENDRQLNTGAFLAKQTEEEAAKMDEVNNLIAELQREDTKLLTKRREHNEQLINYATLSTTAESLLSLAIIIILVYIVLRELRSRLLAQEKLAASVAQLETQTVELKRSESDLKTTMDELASINKQLEKFVYTVAHDIKSPLSGIVGALSIIADEEVVIENSRVSQFVTLSADAAVHLTDMVNFLLEYSRVSLAQQAPETVNTKELLEQLSMLLFPPKNVHISVSGKMPVFTTRKLKLIQVFQNLLSNAIKYNDKEKGIIEVGYEEKGQYYLFYVKDNGQGIADTAKADVFKLSKTAGNKSRADSSTGFGLNIAKMIVEEQGGQIWFDSVEGLGSAFYFEWRNNVM